MASFIYAIQLEKSFYMPSTVIRHFEYDEALQTLTITFVSGSIYQYENVNNELVNAFRAFREKGVFYNQHIKGKFAFTRINKPGQNISG